MAMLKVDLIIIFIFSCIFLSAQQKKITAPIVGVEALMPIGTVSQQNQAVGYSFFIRGEYFLRPKFSFTIHGAYSTFNGDIVYWDGSKDNSFTLLPILIGARYYYKKIFAAIEVGPAFALSSNANTLPVISPIAGIKLNRTEIGIRVFSTSSLPSTTVNTFLEKGGYNYVGLHLNYNLSKPIK